MKYSPLALKVNSILIIGLVIGIGTITFFLSTTLIQTVDELSRVDMIRQGDTIYAAIESLMLPGEAPLAQGFFERLAALDSEQRLMLYRTDGIQAFQDNTTLFEVNQNLGRVAFQPREHYPVPLRADTLSPEFQQASGAQGIPRDIFQRISHEGQVEYRILRPLINLPKCIVCHGSDHTVRGVLEITSDISSLVQIQQQAILWASGGFFTLVLFTGWGLGKSISLLILKPLQLIGKVCDQVALGNLDQRSGVLQKDEIGVLSERVNTMIEGLVERFKLTQYVSGSTIKSLQGSEEGRRVNMTLFFSDIRGFTKYTEKQEPEHTVSQLNAILDLQTRIIHSWNGDIDKYVGDEIFALFEGSQGPANALRAGIEIQKALATKMGQFDGLHLGIGIHVAQVILGRIGSETRGDFTVIGDGVNIASRLCSSAKEQTIILSKEVFDQLNDLFSPEKIQKNESQAEEDADWKAKIRAHISGPYRLTVKGKTEALRVFKWEEGEKI